MFRLKNRLYNGKKYHDKNMSIMVMEKVIDSIVDEPHLPALSRFTFCGTIKYLIDRRQFDILFDRRDKYDVNTRVTRHPKVCILLLI